MADGRGRYVPQVVVAVASLSALVSGVVVWAAPGAQPWLIFGNVLLGLGAVAHATFLMGWRRALAFCGLTCGLSFGLEMLSVGTGLATPYHYTALLGPSLAGVAVVVPLGWLFMLYASHILVNFIAEGGPVSTRGGTGWLLLLALLTALVMTAWDLTLDPFMTGKAGAWVWDQAGPYLGIPLANYVNWVETAFIIAVACRLVDRALAARPSAPAPQPMPRAWQAWPIAVYALVGLSATVIGFPPAARVLSPFAMGIPVLAGLARVCQAPGEAA